MIDSGSAKSVGKDWRRDLWRYALAVGAVAVAAVVRWGLDDILRHRATFITFYPAIAAVGMLAGGRAGLVATALSVLVADLLFTEPRGTFAMNSLSEWVALGMFATGGILISAMAGMLGRARIREWQAAERAKIAEILRESESRARVALAIKEEKQRFEDLLNRLPVYVALLSPDYRVPFANRFFEERFGKSQGRRCFEYLFNRSEPCENCETFKVLQTKAPHNWEWVGPDGHNYEIHDFPFTDANGAEMIMEVGIDVTARKQAEAAVRAERQRFLDMLDTLPVIIDIIRADHRIEWSNRAYREALGDNQGKLCYASQFGHDKPCEECQAFIPLKTGQPHHWEWTLPNGRTFDIYNFPFAAADGSPAILEMDIDITERRKAEAALKDLNETLEQRVTERTQALRESEERFRLLADGTPVIIWVHDKVGGLRFANRAYCEFFGVTLEQVAGGDWKPLVHAEDVPGYVDAFLTCHEERRPFHAQARVQRHDGQWRWIESFAVPRFSGANEFLGMTGSSVDITERKEAEAVLARGREELERLVAERTAKLQELVGELEHFSYTITHDMRAPLRAMKAFGDVVVNDLCANCPRQEPKSFLKRIMTSADRMDLLIRDALNYSRSVRQELPLELVDTGALLREMLDSYPELQPSKAQIRVEGELPVVMGNEAGLTQCFSNLLGNAVKFVKPGQTPEIRIWAEMRPVERQSVSASARETFEPGHAPRFTPDASTIRIWVEDKGIGIPQALLPRVFDMFSRGHNNYEGTGIGLALVRKVMDRMGGKVGVESEEGKGSRFWLDLKLGEKG